MTYSAHWGSADRDEAAAYARRLDTQALRDAAHQALAETALYDDAADFAERMYGLIGSAQA